MPYVSETGDEVQALVNAVLEDGAFDATAAQALRWLHERQKTMCARSGCYRKSVGLGETVQGQDTYELPAGIVRLLEVSVGGVPYGEARHGEFYGLQNFWLWLRGGLGPRGVAARADNAAGKTQLRIFPAGGEQGVPLEIYAVMLPPKLELGDDSTLVVPAEYYGALADGAIALGSGRGEARIDLASAFEQRFAEACTELRKATRRKYQGSGPHQIRVTM